MKVFKFVCLTLFMASLFFVISFLFLPEFSIYSKQNQFIEELNCKYIAVYDGDAHLDKEYKLLNNYYSIYDENKKVKADILMQNKNKAILNETLLKSNEVAVSKNFLGMGYEIGDSIIVTSPKNDDKLYFTIADIIIDCYGISNEVLDENKHLIIFGYDENNIKSFKTNIAFIDDEDLSNNSVKLLKFMKVIDIYKYNNSKIMPLIIFETVLKVMVCVIYYAVFIMLFRYIIRRYIINGRSTFNILMTSYFKYCLPLIISIVISVVATFIYSFVCLSYIPIFVIFFTSIILVLLVVMFLDLKNKMRRN